MSDTRNWRIEELASNDRVRIDNWFCSPSAAYKRTATCKRRYCGRKVECWVAYDFDQFVKNRNRVVVKSPRRGYCREHANDMIVRHGGRPRAATPGEQDKEAQSGGFDGYGE